VPQHRLPWVKISDVISEQINPREETMNEETLRKIAIEQYLQGKEPVSIYHEKNQTLVLQMAQSLPVWR